MSLRSDPEQRFRPALWVLIAYLVLVPPLQSGGGSPEGILGIHTAILILAVIRLLPGFRANNPGWRIHPVLIGPAAFCAISAVSFLRASYRYGSFLTLLNWLLFFTLAWILFHLQWSKRERIFLQWLLLLGTTFQAAVALSQFWGSGFQRPAAFFVNRNHLAAYLGIGFWVAAARFLEEKDWRWRIPPVVSGVLLMVASFSIGSRGGLLSLFGVLFLALFLRGFRLPLRQAVGSLVAALFLVAVAGGAVAYRFRTAEDPYPYARFRIWAAVGQAIADHPLLGMGPGMLEHRFHNYNPPEPGAPVRYTKRFLSAHSTYLQVLVETGPMGLFSFLMGAGFLLRCLLHRRSRSTGPREFPWLALALGMLFLHAVIEDLLGVPALVLSLLVPVSAELAPIQRPPSGGQTREPGGEGRRRLSLMPAGIAVAGTAYLFWGLVLSPYLADLHFKKMLSSPGRAEFTRQLRLAIRYNPFQPYYYSEAARRVLRSVDPLNLEAFAVCHAYLRTAIHLEPGEPGFHRDLARLYDRAFRDLFRDTFTRDQVLASYRSAVSLNRRDPRPLVEMARFQRLIGRDQESLLHLERALEVEPAYGAAHLERLEVLDALGREEEWRIALRQLEEAVKAGKEYQPRNDYEKSILRVEPERWEKLRSQSASPLS